MVGGGAAGRTTPKTWVNFGEKKTKKDQQRRTEVIEDEASLASRQSKSKFEVAGRKIDGASAINIRAIVALIADLTSKEAGYARNAVLGPHTTEDGPCP
jgi:hypothetical protein